MKTECTQNELRFQTPGRRDVRMRFDGGQITSDGGFALLAAVDQRVRATERFAACFADHRAPERVDQPRLPRALILGRTRAYRSGARIRCCAADQT